MADFDVSHYPAGLQALLTAEEACPLDAGAPNRDAYDALRRLDLKEAFAPLPIVDQASAKACWSALWLLHNYLDESHSLSQDLPDSTGSFWHGIMHRREGDFSNAKYWFRNAGEHPVLTPLAADAAEIIGNTAPEKTRLVAPDGRLDPFALVDWVNASSRGDHSQDAALRRLARREWERLFDWCFHRAVGV